MNCSHWKQYFAYDFGNYTMAHRNLPVTQSGPITVYHHYDVNS